jgi:phosphate uptake regulator
VETRKVQVTGKSTYVVSLPKKWVNSVQVKNGDSVILAPLPDGTLLINPKLKKTEKELTKKVITVDSSDNERLLRRFIGAYLAGYNIIEFRTNGNSTKTIRQDIRELSHSVIGPQLIEETANSMVLRDLLDSSDFSMLKGIKRMYIITREMHQDAISILNTHNQDLAEDVVSRDQEVDKLYWMISKQYNLIIRDVFFADKMGVSPLEAQGFLLVARTLERVADHAVRIANNSIKVVEKDSIVPKIIARSGEVIKLLDDAMNSFYINKFESADDAVNRAKLMARDLELLSQDVLSMKGEAANIVPLAYVVESLERTMAYASDIGEAAINHYFVMEYNSATIKGSAAVQ